jgi:hypothetical protein
MCIIISKTTGIEMPTSEILKNCSVSNTDGAGFAYALPGEMPRIVKGFTNIGKLERAFVNHGITINHNVIIHFRFATHGLKNRQNCHPFPLTNDLKEMQYLECSCDCAVAHNGIFGDMPPSDKYSDTMKFVAGVLASPHILAGLHMPPVKELIKGYCGYSSKLAFLTRAGITLIGHWQLEDGLQYSNHGYKGYTRVTTYPACQENADGELWHMCNFCKEHKKATKYDFEADIMLCDDCETQLQSYED